jgi:plastocyanin/uncharacterized membrane protein
LAANVHTSAPAARFTRRGNKLWRVRQGLFILLLLCASRVSVARPQVFTSTAAISVADWLAVQSPSSSPAAQPAASGQQVIIKGMRFQPAELNVHAGDTVEFRNEDIFAHTVTADDGSFNSGLIQPGSTWKLNVTKSDTIRYHCTPHPNMKAALVVSSGTGAKAGGAARVSPRFNFPSSPQEIHPILVNFTAALLPLAFLSDLLGLWWKRASLHNAASWMVLYAAVITPLTGAAGWWWRAKSAGTLPPAVITVHQWLGTSLAVLFILLAVWRWRFQKKDVAPSFGYMIIAAITVLALVYQGSLGGLMVFGR